MNTNPHRDDDYLPCQDYIIEGNDSSGITRFENEGKFYFSFSENNKIILRSEGYSNEAGRENGIASVLKNINNEDLYHTRRLPDGRWILSLKAGNHQEIARSCPFNTEEEVLVLMPGARKRATSQINLAAVEAGSIKQEGISFADDSSVGQNVEDDYMICREYEEKISSKHPEYSDFISFKHENTGKYYFAMINKNNEIVFRSEGYPTTAARDNGIESVRKKQRNSGENKCR
ncbi:MAG: YegP family protein [Saprospiraceae bacterium]|nr:YegP family protein [Saprospiraceae bacterium]